MCDNASHMNENTNKEKGENSGTRVAACRYLSSQTYTPKPEIERVLYMNWLVRARRKGHYSQRK